MASFCFMPLESSARPDRPDPPSRSDPARSNHTIRPLDTVEARIHQQVHANAQPLPVARGLRQQAYATSDAGAVAVDAKAINRGRALARRYEPGEHPERGGLAGAVRSEQREDFTAPHVEGEIVDRKPIAEAPAELRHRDHGTRGC